MDSVLTFLMPLSDVKTAKEGFKAGWSEIK